MVTKSLVNKLLAYCNTRESQTLLKELVMLSCIEPQFIIDTIEEQQSLGQKGIEGKYTKAVLDFICDYSSITYNELMSNSRKRHITDPRRLAMYFIYSGTHLNKSAVARFFKKDHATILHALKGHEILLQVDKSYKAMYDNVQARLEFAQYNTHKNGNESSIPLGADGLLTGGDEQLEAEGVPA